jgi:hypothetical protein
MKPFIRQVGDSFIYSCVFDKTSGYEQFIPESLLAYQISGKTQIYHQKGEMTLEEGQFLLARGNQFAKSIKIPADHRENTGAFRCC